MRFSPPEADATPAPEPKAYVPQDLFGSELNPYCDAGFPDYFNVYAASFSKGSAKLEGKAPYTLSMTAKGNADGAVAFLAALAGLNEDERISRTDEYKRGGFCEFQGRDGALRSPSEKPAPVTTGMRMWMAATSIYV